MITKEMVYDEERFKKFEQLRKDYNLPKDGTVHKMKITPRFAKRLKELVPPFQRKLVKAHVKNLGVAITTDEFQFIGDSFCFDTYGNFINGQQRVEAVINEKKSITCNITTGLDPIKAYKAIDIFWKRKGFDSMLKYAGYPSCNKLGAALVWVYRYERGLPGWDTARFETTQIGFDVLERNPNIEHSIPYGSRMPKEIVACALAVSCHCLCSLIDKEQANQFFTALATGATNGTAIQVNNPIFQCRRTLQADYIKAKTTAYGKMRPVFTLAFLINTWNAWRLGKKLRSPRTLYWRKNNYAEKFPKPI